jgi:hypothetical protein
LSAISVQTRIASDAPGRNGKQYDWQTAPAHERDQPQRAETILPAGDYAVDLDCSLPGIQSTAVFTQVTSGANDAKILRVFLSQKFSLRSKGFGHRFHRCQNTKTILINQPVPLAVRRPRATNPLN